MIDKEILDSAMDVVKGVVEGRVEVSAHRHHFMLECAECGEKVKFIFGPEPDPGNNND